jgi:hypothetical protein
MISARASKGVAAIVNVDLQGNVTPLFEDTENRVGWTIPSPDGSRAAYRKQSMSSNVWLFIMRYTTSSYAVHFKCAANFSEAQMSKYEMRQFIYQILAKAQGPSIRFRALCACGRAEIKIACS